MQHCGHAQIAAGSARATKSSVSPDDRHLIDQMFRSNIPTSTIASILHERGGCTLSSSQINNLRNEVDIAGAEGGCQPKTSAEKLLHYLSAQTDVTYVAIFGNFDTLSGPRIQVKWKRRGQPAVILGSEDVDAVLGSTKDAALDEVKFLKDALMVDKVDSLLAVTLRFVNSVHAGANPTGHHRRGNNNGLDRTTNCNTNGRILRCYGLLDLKTG